ncbi:MAG: YdiU family protein [Mariprofundaceae bacterium]|nr:YdiU family protein [Mariprofundaceae bacterium]
MNFFNTYASLGESFYKKSQPAWFESPELKLWNRSLADELLIPEVLQADLDALAACFSGQRRLNGSQSIATAYAGHQFGHFVPQLGDGRAHLLGDLLDRSGKPREIQLKGSGQTPFSRGGDGRCALGPALREYIMSEAMFALGVPTTRCLAVVGTGETVFRQHPLPGAVVTRVAASHIRVGTFQYFSAKGDIQAVKELCDYTVKRHYPELQNEVENKAVLLLEKVMEKQLQLMVEWMRVGFIHGVMNTDNCTLSGETIDFGPCAMIGHYDPERVFSSIDTVGRYAFGKQAKMAQWNMARFGECLLPLVHHEKSKALDTLMPLIEAFSTHFQKAYQAMMGKKLGLKSMDEKDEPFIQELLNRMQQKQLDYTRTFDALTKSLDEEQPEIKDQLGLVYANWKKRLLQQNLPLDDIQSLMRRHNPVVIPRNHHVESILQICEQTGDMNAAKEFLKVLESPYKELPETHRYQDEVSDTHYQTFCGT